MKTLLSAVPFTVLLTALPAPLAAAPYLVKDLNTFSAIGFDADLEHRGTAPGISYFASPDPAHGVELWRSDGTPGGTERLTDICAGRCDSLPRPPTISVHDGRVFFRADDGVSGEELWVSDGTPGSERRVRDACPGPCSSYPGTVAAAGDHLVYFPYFPTDGTSFGLWQTDGTREGTLPVKALCTADCYADDPISIGDRALFLVNGMDLWSTDGTAAGTGFLRQFQFHSPTSGTPYQVIPSDGFAWVWDTNGLWRTDGTAAGTFLLQPLDALTTPSTFTSFLNQQAQWHGLFFGIVGAEILIRSDGTPEGTFRIMSLPDGLRLAGLSPLDGEVLFQVFHADDSSNNSVLWSTRGTAETTGPAVALETAKDPGVLTSLGDGRAVFMAGEGAPIVYTQVWVTDGTAAGTRRLALPPGTLSSSRLEFFTTGDGRALFFRDFNLWVTDGTEAGTHAVRSWETAGSSGPLEQAALGGRLVFSATNGRDPVPFVSDGTDAGTEMLNARAQSPSSFFPFGGRLLFSASAPHHSPHLWATDGTPAGTAVISRQTEISQPALFAGRILFAGNGKGGQELWRSDSLARSFQLVKDIDPFIQAANHHTCVNESSFPVFAGVIGGRMLFAADDGRSGRELWASDGTAQGTGRVRDINPGRSTEAPPLCPDPPLGPHRHDIGLSSNPQDFVLLGSVVLFTADDGLTGRELWISNGTLPGTRRVADLVPGPRGAAPHDLVRFGNRVYFLAPNIGAGGPGESLWRTDGTAQGTTRVLDLTLDGQPSWGRSLTIAAGRLFFSVYNETTGAELWASAGDAASTGMVTDLNPGPGSASPQVLTAVGRFLLFAADDGLTGLEPWRSDGTAAGTFRVGDIAPGRDASSPGPFTALSNLVMTGADDGVHGRELWAIPRIDIFQPLE